MTPAQRGAILLTAVMIGVAAGLVAVPVAFRRIPNDLSRVATVLQALRDTPEVIVLGDSRAEASVDARRLSSELPGRPRAFNLAWHAQRFAHSFAIALRAPHSARIVVILVSLQDLSDSFAGDPRVWGAMRTYGYEPDSSIVDTMTAAFGSDTPRTLTVSRLRANFDARWGVRQFADTAMRGVARRDLRLAREREDLHFPTAYTQRLPAERFDAMLSVMPAQLAPRAVSVPKERLLVRLGEAGRERNLRIVLVVAATHPSLMVVDHEQRIASLRVFVSRNGLEVIDGSAWLADEDFVDPLHASADGARKFTSALAAALGSHR